MGNYTGKQSSSKQYIPDLVACRLISATAYAFLSGLNVLVNVELPVCTISGISEIRTGYWQNASNGGMVNFTVDSSGGVNLKNAFLNGSDVTSSTTWFVLYRYFPGTADSYFV